ncbi:hypothetical protein D7004_04055 [Pedobacter jejuensis]|uniref:Uncharacterized protein n=1 Tax=Pedobacter jejuensis TaxID=1268550 RepID=A0A3N0C182_9SPHI|nr:hypothetical protein D7004_04055 [Pedobacter jejuensis]
MEGKLQTGRDVIAGAIIILNNRNVSNSNNLGNFKITAKIGDTLKIKSPFYNDFTKVLNDSLPQTFLLNSKELDLGEVKITFNKRKTIDSLLLLAFSKLDKNAYSKQGFLRQSITENNSKIVLLNEGVLNFFIPKIDELTVEEKGYKAVKINIKSSCTPVQLADKKIILNSNPQVKLRRGITPDYYYHQLTEHILTESIHDDGNFIIINIRSNLPKFSIVANYIYTITKDSNSLKQIQSYEEDQRGDYFFMNFEYLNNEVISIHSSAKQFRQGVFYSTNDEFFLRQKLSTFDYPINFNANKCGLHLYKETSDCDDVKKYKEFNKIADQKYF